MLPTMSVSTRYKITKRDLAATWDAIKQIGYDDALDMAFNGTIIAIEKDPNAALATNYLSWSCNLLLDHRGAKDDEKEKFLILSRFYRTLAHRVYWRQRADGTIGQIGDFIQLVKAKK